MLIMVPEARLELAQARGPGDFESPASTHSTTPASEIIVSWHLLGWQAFCGTKGDLKPSRVRET